MFKRIKKLRISNKLNIDYISNFLNVSPEFYIDIESGKIDPTIRILSKLAKLYNTSIDYIVGDTDSKVPHRKKM